MTMKENRRLGDTITGRTWVCTGTTMVAMGMVAVAAELVLQKQLPDSNCKESCNSISQLQNVKVGISCGIPVVFYGMFCVLVGICRSKPLVIMLAFLSILSAMFALTLLVISEVNIVSSFHENMSTVHLPFTTPQVPHSQSFRGRLTEVNGGLQETTSRHGDSFLRFSPSDVVNQLERNILRGDDGTRFDRKSAIMNNKDDHNSKYQHEPNTDSDDRRQADSWLKNAEEQSRNIDRQWNPWNRMFSGWDSLDFEEILHSSAEASSSEDPRTTGTATLASDGRAAEDMSFELSGYGEGYDDDEDSHWPAEAEERREKDEYDLYSELEEGEDNRTAEEQRLSVIENSYKDGFSAVRNKRDWNLNYSEEEKEDDEEIARQWLVKLMMSCLMAVVGVIVLVTSIVTATLAFAPFCCHQKGKKTNVTPVTAAGKDEADVPLLSSDESLLQV